MCMTVLYTRPFYQYALCLLTQTRKECNQHECELMGSCDKFLVTETPYKKMWMLLIGTMFPTRCVNSSMTLTLNALRASKTKKWLFGVLSSKNISPGNAERSIDITIEKITGAFKCNAALGKHSLRWQWQVLIWKSWWTLAGCLKAQ